jgi:hypothetical protein
MKASEITTDGGNGKGSRRRQQVKQWFFLNRVHIYRHDLTVDKAVQISILVLPYITYTSFPVFDNTTVSTQTALDLYIFNFFVQEGLSHAFIISQIFAEASLAWI